MALNYTVSADVCGIPDVVFRSLRVLQRPTCDNGAIAVSAFYHNAVCKNVGYSFDPALTITNIPDRYHGDCLSLDVEFNSLAFLCAGLDETGASPSLTSISRSLVSKTVTSSILSSASATPVAPSASMTSPLYMAPAGSSFPGSVPINTTSSGIVPSAGSTALPITTGFTGAAPRLDRSIAGVFFVLGGAILL